MPADRNDIGVLAELPSELHYLIEPAMKYGRYQFDDDVDEFLRTVREDELIELEEIASRVRADGDYDKVKEWLHAYRITEFEEASRLYFLFGVLDAADLKFD
jgi:hypothetical protein